MMLTTLLGLFMIFCLCLMSLVAIRSERQRRRLAPDSVET